MPSKIRGLTEGRALGSILSMIEIISFFLGLGFSLLVYVLSIRPLDHPWPKKAGYFFFTLIGITGSIFLAGVVIAHFLRNLLGVTSNQ